MLHRLHLLFLLLAACGLLAAGCGDGDTPDTKGEAQQECLEQAKKIDDSGARKTAEEACTGDADKARDEADEARDDIVKRCLDEAKTLPDDQRKTAEEICRAAK